jgi:ATP-dependent RNA helicase DHX57
MINSKDTASHLLPTGDESHNDKTAEQLMLLGFTEGHIKKAMQFLTTPSSTLTYLSSSLSPLEACIEYLILYLPECDLPKRFLPDFNSSNPLVTSAHSGADDLKRRWAEDRAVKEAGWPLHVVKELTDNPALVNDWNSLLVALNGRLLGRSDKPEATNSAAFSIDSEEVDAMGGHFEGTSHLILPLFTAPVSLHVFVSETSPSPLYSPMYISSSSVPSYIRLHLLSKLLLAINDNSFLQDGQGFCLASITVIEDEWARIENSGYPELSYVLRHMVPNQIQSRQEVHDILSSEAQERGHKKQTVKTLRHDNRSDNQVKADLHSLFARPEVSSSVPIQSSFWG